jgi:hypothetical protein
MAETGPIDYPDSYRSPAPFIRELRTAERDPTAPDDPAALEWYCFTCTFRPWLDSGDARSAEVTIIRRDGSRMTVPAAERGDRWATDYVLGPGEQAIVEAGAVRDAYGNFNGASSPPVSRGS